MAEDIRDKPSLSSRDILDLNFIRTPSTYRFRRHFRAGLRSHIMEILRPEDVERENRGIVLEGVTCFPRARPVKMLRLFRTRFQSLHQAHQELARVKLIQDFLAPDHLALSNEFLVDYKKNGTYEILLCGLQEYVEGEILDPWRHLDGDHLAYLWSRLGVPGKNLSGMDVTPWTETVHTRIRAFVEKIKKMVLEAGYIPDLAGVGNLLVTRSGDLKLVDINNISTVCFDPEIRVDDRGYPVCDKSIQAVFRIEQQLPGDKGLRGDPVFGMFLEPARMQRVRTIEQAFHDSLRPS